jgi:hypothetical protein
VTSLVADRVEKSALFSGAPRALVRLCSKSQRELWGLRLGRIYGFGIGVSYALVLFVGSGSMATVAQLWGRALATASWVAGIGALSLARDLSARDAARGLSGLSRLHGYSELELERARTLAGALRLSSTVAVPGLLLSLAALVRVRTFQGVGVALLLALLTLPYALLVGGSLAPLARVCSRLLPGRGRLLLLALVLGPWLLGSGLDLNVPSLPAAFGWLLRHLTQGFS